MKKDILKYILVGLSLLISSCDKEPGPQGPQGIPGEVGPTGEKGDPGEDGKTPYIGDNGNWWIGDVDTNVKAEVTINDNFPFVVASDYGIVPGKVDSNKLQNLLDNKDINNKTIIFEDGVYEFSSQIDIPSNITLLGNANTIFTLDENSLSNTLFSIVNVDNIYLKNLFIEGSDSLRPSSKGKRSGIWIESSRSVNIENVDIYGWSLHGIYGKTMSSYGSIEEGKFFKQLQISNSRFYFNYYGTYFDYRCEYSQVLNCVFAENYIGSLNCGGNNMYVSCMYNSNYYGFVNENEGSNPAHGSCNSSTFNHNYSHAILVKNCVNGWVFDGCQVFYGKIELVNCIGVIFNSTIFGSCSFISSNNKKNVNMISDSYFLTDSKTILKGNDGSTLISNCLPDYIEKEEEDVIINNNLVVDTYFDDSLDKKPLSTNAYSGATSHPVIKNTLIDYVDFEVYGASSNTTTINGINIWIVNADTGEVIEKLADNESKQVIYNDDIKEYVVRYEINKSYDYGVCFIIQATRENNINFAYYTSNNSNIKGYLVGDVAPNISDIVSSNNAVIPIYRVYKK